MGTQRENEDSELLATEEPNHHQQWNYSWELTLPVSVQLFLP